MPVTEPFLCSKTDLQISILANFVSLKEESKILRSAVLTGVWICFACDLCAQHWIQSPNLFTILGSSDELIENQVTYIPIVCMFSLCAAADSVRFSEGARWGMAIGRNRGRTQIV